MSAHTRMPLRHLLKRFLPYYGKYKKEIAFDLAMLTKSECIQVIGRQIVLYKRAKEPKIILP